MPNQETGNSKDLKDTHTAREPPPDDRVVAFHAADRPRHCAYLSTMGVDVPNGLHRTFVLRLTRRGLSLDDANAMLFKWYRQVESDWQGREVVEVVAVNDYEFWRARWREAWGTIGRDVAPRKVAGLAGGGVAASSPPVAPWECRHEPRCPHRTACALVTTREVRAGLLTVEDVPAVLRADVQDFLEAPPSPQAVRA